MTALEKTAPRFSLSVNALLLLWVILTLIPSAYLMAGHLITLPAPEAGMQNGTLVHAIATLRHPNESTKWLAVHVLLSTCGCSKRVVDRLIERGPRADAAERILLIEGDDLEVTKELLGKLRSRGFAAESLSPDQLSRRFSIESAPMFIVLSPNDTLSYVGGYTDRKQSASIRDSEILVALERHQTVKRLPLFGCAVSKSLQKALDPLGLKK